MIAGPARLATYGLALGVFRHAIVLGGMWRARTFLRTHPTGGRPWAAADDPLPQVYVVLPVLREATVLEAAVRHFGELLPDPTHHLLIVTTARETAERDQHPHAGDTVALATDLAAQGRCVHLHAPDPTGLKADQVNHAADHLVGQPDIDPATTFLLCYDADSRPDPASLDDFARAIADHPGSDVFHQSSRFELRATRTPDRARGAVGWAREAITDAGALRANRFVLAYELPRLLRRSRNSRSLGCAAQVVYTHVTGHGLCLRLSLLRELPLPVRSPLEDMHYSFLLNTRGTAMVPIPSLDAAEVPGAVSAQYRQAAQWFLGPGRFLKYRHDQRARPGWRREATAVTAALICLEWLSCAATPALLARATASRAKSTRWLAAGFAALQAAQLLLTDLTMHPHDSPGGRLRRLAGYPAATTVFGFGGWLGALRLATGRVGAVKTERN